MKAHHIGDLRAGEEGWGKGGGLLGPAGQPQVGNDILWHVVARSSVVSFCKTVGRGPGKLTYARRFSLRPKGGHTSVRSGAGSSPSRRTAVSTGGAAPGFPQKSHVMKRLNGRLGEMTDGSVK